MTFVSCSIPEQFVNPLFEVFDGGDFILSSYRDIEEDFTRMRIYFEDPAQTEAAKKALADAMSVVGVNAPIEVGDIPDEDWKLAYRRHFKTEEIGKRLVVVPEWEVKDFRRKTGAAKREMIVLDPGMAFGTGKHETTRACLEYIDELAPGTPHQAPGTSFLDMGCGSGILSIAAAKLGFSPVKGFDVDQEAVDASIENAAKNGVTVDYVKFALGRKIESSARGRMVGCSDVPMANRENTQVKYDLVAANILGPLLIRFADEIVPSVGKNLIISGILTELYPEVLAAYEARGLKEVSRKTIGEWTTGLLAKQGR
ncbi:MAG: 50S ribosomal protein L11 methyltransferase [Kiritimatiellae bacterium]|nr:50S ribosomal protein L11 methyltransferase [Kiritimatiellia bacterium]